jgi:hypothetical protein
LLSIDIDGIDYWVWKAIEVISPRVVVIEYNSFLGAQEPLTIRYDPKFCRQLQGGRGLYFGASLAALEKLGKAKGYILAGCESHGVNAFFVRQDAAAGIVPALTAAQAYFPYRSPTIDAGSPAIQTSAAAQGFIRV